MIDGWERIFQASGETHEIRVRKPHQQKALMAVRIKRTMAVPAETVVRFLANTANRETWDTNLSDVETIATLSNDLKFVRLNYGGVTASFLVNKVKHENQYLVVGECCLFSTCIQRSSC